VSTHTSLRWRRATILTWPRYHTRSAHGHHI
jgi:hypothetical protein